MNKISLNTLKKSLQSVFTVSQTAVMAKVSDRFSVRMSQALPGNVISLTVA